jgi:predicted Kef-type K+ transport protein
LAKRYGSGILIADRIMHEVSFLQDLAVVMIAAGIVTVLFQRLKQPVVLGYIVAGILIGPHLLELIKEQDAIKAGIVLSHIAEMNLEIQKQALEQIWLSPPDFAIPLMTMVLDKFPYLTSGVADQFRLRHGTLNGLAKGMVATSFRFQEMPG